MCNKIMDNCTHKDRKYCDECHQRRKRIRKLSKVMNQLTRDLFGIDLY